MENEKKLNKSTAINESISDLEGAIKLLEETVLKISGDSSDDSEKKPGNIGPERSLLETLENTPLHLSNVRTKVLKLNEKLVEYLF